LEATGFRYGDLRQATTYKLVPACHEAVVGVQSRLRTRMAAPGEVVLRLRVCLGNECRAVFLLCSHCDRGQRYCSLACRDQARLRQRRCANRRHQQSLEGRLDHRDRQREYRRRRAHRAPPAGVTDHGSLLIASPASSQCGEVNASAIEVAPRSDAAGRPRWPEKRPGIWLCCRICGRAGRFIDPFPSIPRRM
jgi:hypothetical protein